MQAIKGLVTLLVLLGMGLSVPITYSASASLNESTQHKHAWFELSSYQPVVTFTVGPDFVNAGQAQSLSLRPPFENYYTKTNESNTVAEAGAFLGVERTLTAHFATQIGVSGYIDSQIPIQGHVWQFGVPEFDNLTYSYDIQNIRVMLTGKLLGHLTNYQALQPYFSWEVGAAFNQARGYQESSFTPDVLPMTPFANHRETAFSYGVGVGVDYSINTHLRAGMGYQFADLGSASLGLTPVETTTQTLQIAHIYTNQLRFQLTFLI
jgi:opacity protein-like surface antigen